MVAVTSVLAELEVVLVETLVALLQVAAVEQHCLVHKIQAGGQVLVVQTGSDGVQRRRLHGVGREFAVADGAGGVLHADRQRLADTPLQFVVHLGLPDTGLTRQLSADEFGLQREVRQVREPVAVQSPFQGLQWVAAVLLGVLVELCLKIGIRDDHHLGVDVHRDPLVQLDGALVGHVQQLPQQVGVLGGVLDDGETTVALREHAVVGERLWVLSPARAQFLEHPAHPGADQPLLRRALVLGMEHADALADIDDVVLHPEVGVVGDRRKQVLDAVPAVLLLQVFVCLPGEGVESALDADRNVVIARLVHPCQQRAPDLRREREQRV